MKNKILDLFQSQEMKKYINENFDDLSSFQINSIICGARESLENKLSILSELKATDEIYENITTIFILMLQMMCHHELSIKIIYHF